jgi:RimJ/RimL family protein N-acetyltransferase
MTVSASLQQLSGGPSSYGLFDDVNELQHGRTRLALDGYRYDPARKLPLYVFNLVADDGATVGQYHFAPGEPDRVGATGNAGGHVAPEYRNKGHSKDAVKALGTLARRHGMATFIITCPKSNGAARKALEQVGEEIDQQHEETCFYRIPSASR